MGAVGQPAKRVRFDCFEANLDTGELRKHGVRVKLHDQPFQILAMLIARPGEMVTREEIQGRLWPSGTFVDFENGMNRAVNRLREALADCADQPKFIETIPRHGYRFLAPVSSNSRRERTKNNPGWKTTAITAIVVIAAASVAVGFSWRSRQKQRLTEKDSIVLADFVNTTGDRVFDDALKQGLRVQLEQSPFLKILSDQKVNDVLQMMGRPKDERLTQDITREVCQRASSKAFLVGTISSLGTHFVVGLKALNCQTGDGLASEQMEADSREHVLKALGESATSMRIKLGESLAMVQKYDAPMEETATPSLEALRAYSLAIKTWTKKGPEDAVPFFKRAVQLDPQFAIAFARLAMVYSQQGETALAAENARHAYELRERASEPERLYIEGHYYDQVTGELDKAATLWELMQQTYPRYSSSYLNLAGIYAQFGNYEKALEEGLEARRLSPDDEETYDATCNSYIALNRLDEAEAVLKEAENRKLDSVGLIMDRYELAVVKDDTVEMERLETLATNKPLLEAILLRKAYMEAANGRLIKAREILTRPGVLLCHDCMSLIEADVGDMKQAKRDAAMALKESKKVTISNPSQVLALALALTGDVTHAEKLASELNSKFPLNTTMQRFWLPTIRAAVAMEHKDANKAIELLREMSPNELGTPYLFPVYVRGRAYLMQGNGSAAAADFRLIVDHPGIGGGTELGALAHLQLGRAYAMQSDTPKARAAYQAFLTLWKDADPEIPVFIAAKSEYARLK